MRIAAILLAIAANAAPAIASEPSDAAGEGALLVFEQRSLQLGVFDRDSVQTGRFKIYNRGDEPLVIRSIFTDCGCTKAQYERKPVEPGDSAYITVRFDGRGRAHGRIRKAVRIRSTPRDGGYSTGFVDGTISRPTRR